MLGKPALCMGVKDLRFEKFSISRMQRASDGEREKEGSGLSLGEKNEGCPKCPPKMLKYRLNSRCYIKCPGRKKIDTEEKDDIYLSLVVKLQLYKPFTISI